jgi:hypothetical protein
MAGLVKTIQAEPIALQLIAAATGVVKSAVYNVSTFFSAVVYWDFSPSDTTAAAAATMLAIQASQKASGNDTWIQLQEWLSPGATGSNPGTGTNVAGSDQLTLSAGAIAANSLFFILDATLGNSEWGKRVAQAALVVTAEDGLTNAHAAQPVWVNGERYKIDVDLSGVKRLRIALYNNRGATTRPVYCRVGLTTCDEIQ